MSTNLILSVKDIRCGYNDTEIVHGISFDVSKNEKLCILGPNGCGKTTLLRALNKIIHFSGDITVYGRDIGSIKRKELAKYMVYMSQLNSVYFPYSVYETVMLGRYAYKKGIFSDSEKKDREYVRECMEKTGIWELKDKLLNELSGGQFQRVLLARVFAQSPDIILLDEPTNHLDLKYQLELMEYLDEWVKEKDRCVVSVLHDINMALSFSDKILLMDKGECVCIAPSDELSTEKIDKVYGMDIKAYMQKSLAMWK